VCLFFGCVERFLQFVEEHCGSLEGAKCCRDVLLPEFCFDEPVGRNVEAFIKISWHVGAKCNLIET